MSSYLQRIRDGGDADAAADNMAVRLSVVARIKAGEISLAEGQAELRRIQRIALATGAP